jgi:site-specific DNA recombinase
MSTENKKAAGYIRVSTPSQIKGESLSTQKKIIQEHCKRNELLLVKTYEDAGISGAKSDRPALLQMLQDAKTHQFETLVIHSLSRLGRSARDLLNNAQALKESNVNLVTIKENIDQGNIYGQFMFTVLSAIAELEREMIDERMRENRDGLWEDKKIFMGQPPFGYKWDKESKQLVVDPFESQIYLDMVSMYLDRNMTFLDIASALKHKGKRKNARGDSKKKALWTNASISYILKNTAYYGFYTARNGEIEYPIPALISKSKWDEIQERTQRRKRMSKRTGENLKSYWLRNILICGECGGVIKPHTGAKKEDGSSYRYYACHWRHASAKEIEHYGRHRCEMVYIPADKLEKRIEITFFQMLSLNRKKYAEKILDPNSLKERLKELELQKKALQNDLTKQERILKNIMKLLQDPEMEAEGFRQEYLETRKTIKSIEGQIKDIENVVLSVKEQQKSHLDAFRLLDGNKELIRKIKEAVKNLDPEEKRHLFEGLCPKGIIIETAYDADLEETGWIERSHMRINVDIIQDVIGDKLNLDSAHGMPRQKAWGYGADGRTRLRGRSDLQRKTGA